MSEDSEGRELIVVAGRSGIGSAAAQQVPAGGGRAVSIGRLPDELRMAVTPSLPGEARGTEAWFSDTASWTTGAINHVDGGVMVGHTGHN